MQTVRYILLGLAMWLMLATSTYVGSRLAAPSPPVARRLALAVPGPANPVITVDTNGNYVGPGGGTASTTSVVNDAGNPVPSDTVPGDLQDSVAHFVAATGSGVIKTSTGTFVGMNCQNPSASATWVQVYFGQTIPDAGGTNDSGTAPSVVPMYLPSGSNGSLVESQPMTDGGVWYSSSTQSVLTVDAGVQNVACDFIYR